MVLCYLIASMLDAIWLGGINIIFTFGFWVCFVLLIIWLYTKYSGEYAEIGEYIDYFADIIWNNVRIRRFHLFSSLSFSQRFFILFIHDVYVQQCVLYLDIRRSIKSQIVHVSNPICQCVVYFDMQTFIFICSAFLAFFLQNF